MRGALIAFSLLTLAVSPVRAEDGACCLPNGDCFEAIDRLGCELELLGTYQGDGTSCENVICLGCHCDDGNECTIDSCDPDSGECVFQPRLGSCEDGDACTENDFCDGVCVSGDPLVCDDGNACNGLESCSGGVCLPNNPVVCDRPPPCRSTLGATCDPMTGQCSYPSLPNGTSCSDGNACNGLEICTAGACGSGEPIDCDAPPPCRTALGATCNPKTGQCSYPIVPNGTSCSDGNACDGLELCTAGEGVSGEPVSCDDPPSCRNAQGATCNPETGQCSYPIVPNKTSCSDGNACNGLEICTAGACGSGEPVDCDAPPPCRTALGATCNPETGQCSYPIVPNGTSCSDGNACNGLEVCVGGVCGFGEPVDCDAPPPCRTTGATCSPETGQCEYPVALDGSSCDDGDDCTDSDACDQGECAGVTAPQCVPWRFWIECLVGPAVPVDPKCYDLDLNDDGFIDLRDVAELINQWEAP